MDVPVKVYIYIKKKKIGVCYKKKGEQRSELVPAVADGYQRLQAKARIKTRYIMQQQNYGVTGAFFFLFFIFINLFFFYCTDSSQGLEMFLQWCFVCFLTCAYGCKILDCKYCIKFLFND